MSVGLISIDLMSIGLISIDLSASCVGRPASPGGSR
jgi:hypothetical protein